MLLRAVLQVALMALPWSVRRRALERMFGYEIHPTARIRLSIVLPGHLRMDRGAIIDNLNVIKGMDLVDMGPGAGITRLNWIFGMPAGDDRYYAGVEGRRSELVLAEGGGILSRHLIDCTDSVRIGRYSLLVGYRTQVITHAIDLRTGVQTSGPIEIGDFCQVGTQCILLAGAVLPSHSALGAGSTLRGRQEEPYSIHSGVPAKRVGALDESLAYFRPDSHTAWARIQDADAGRVASADVTEPEHLR